MKTTLFTFSLLAAFALSGCGDKKPADKTGEKTDSTKKETPATETKEEPMDSAAMMKAWMDYATPGDMHTWMAGFNGKWEGEVKHWMDPAAPPTTSKQTAEYKMILGGRYQHSIYKGMWDGQEFVGESTLGYDNSKKIFQNTWVDNMGTGIMMMEGKMDEATKTLTLEGSGLDPATGKDMKMKQVLKFPDDNTQIMEMYCETDGKEQKNMEIKLTRKK